MNSLASAQNVAKKKSNPPPAEKRAAAPPVAASPEVVNGSGTIQKITADGIVVTNAQGGEWTIQLAPGAKEITYLARAEPGWLQAGHYVRFSTRLDKKGRAAGPIMSVMVLSPLKEYPPGVIREVTNDGLNTAGIFSDAPEPQKSAPKKKKKVEAPPEDVSYLVTGRVIENKDGKLSVQADSVVVVGQISPQAKISVEWNEIHAAVGDHAEFKGTKATNSNLSLVESLKITAAEVLKGKTPKRRTKADPKSSGTEDP